MDKKFQRLENSVRKSSNVWKFPLESFQCLDGDG